MMATSIPVEGEAAMSLAEGAALWSFLHDLFRQPGDAQWEWLRSEPTTSAWRLLAAHPACAGGDRAVSEEFPLPPCRPEYEADFIATFEVGVPLPPCPLLESHWNRQEPASALLHENILFFRRFGLAFRQEGAESPDHLRRQLEFLCYLCTLEERSAEPEQVAAARRDYLDRHVRPWVPLAADALARSAPNTWPAAWMSLLAAWCEWV